MARRSPDTQRRRTPAKPEPTELVRHAWAQRIEVEYRSAAVTQATVLWLLQIGASSDVVRAGNRIVLDELKHAEMSRAVWLAAGGTQPPVLDRASLELRRRHQVLEHDVIEAVVGTFCFGETVAVRLFSHLRSGTTVPVARRAFDRILRDEVRHRDFGWLCLEWLLARPDAAGFRALIDSKMPSWVTGLEQVYGTELSGGIKAVTAAERAWGVAPWKEYTAILRRTYGQDFRRRFAKLGIAFGW
jgi:hypothetical protein